MLGRSAVVTGVRLRRGTWTDDNQPERRGPAALSPVAIRARSGASCRVPRGPIVTMMLRGIQPFIILIILEWTRAIVYSRTREAEVFMPEAVVAEAVRTPSWHVHDHRPPPAIDAGPVRRDGGMRVAALGGRREARRLRDHNDHTKSRPGRRRLRSRMERKPASVIIRHIGDRAAAPIVVGGERRRPVRSEDHGNKKPREPATHLELDAPPQAEGRTCQDPVNPLGVQEGGSLCLFAVKRLPADRERRRAHQRCTTVAGA